MTYQPNHIRQEVFKRDFSKRQARILNFIGMVGPVAYIPKLKYFRLCGVKSNKIKDELLILVDKNIIFWDQQENTFQINPNTEEWEIAVISSWDQQEYNELVDLQNR